MVEQEFIYSVDIQPQYDDDLYGAAAYMGSCF